MTANLPQTRAEWKRVQHLHKSLPRRFRITERAAIEACADWLIAHCYRPSESGVVFDRNAQTKAFALGYLDGK